MNCAPSGRRHNPRAVVVPAARLMPLLQVLDALGVQGACVSSRDSFGGTFLHPMAWKMAAKLRCYPNHLLSILNCTVRFRRDLPGDVQNASDIYLQCHAATGELLSGNGGSRNLLRPRGNDDCVMIAFHRPTRRVELYDIIARFETSGRESAVRVRRASEGCFAASIGHGHINCRNPAVCHARGDENERDYSATDYFLHLEYNIRAVSMRQPEKHRTILFFAWSNQPLDFTQAFTSSSSISSGTGPFVRTTSWNCRRSNFPPSCFFAFSRSSRIFIIPIL